VSTTPDHDHVVPPLQYADKLHFGPTTNDTHEGIDTNRMREDRAERMRSVMRAANIPAALVTGAENVRYLCGFFWSEFQLQAGYALFFADHPPVVWAPAGSYHQMPDQAPWIPEWRIARSWLEGPTPQSAAEAESKLFAEEIVAELRDRGLEGEPLAVSEFGPRAIQALQAHQIDTIDGLPLLTVVRRQGGQAGGRGRRLRVRRIQGDGGSAGLRARHQQQRPPYRMGGSRLCPHVRKLVPRLHRVSLPPVRRGPAGHRRRSRVVRHA
jgi:hypothetical protein